MRERCEFASVFGVCMAVGVLAVICGGVRVPGVSCVATGVASIRMTNSLDCSGSLLLPSVNFTSLGLTMTYATPPNGPYNMPMSLCTRIRISTDSVDINTITNAIDAQVTCSQNGTWMLQAWAPQNLKLPTAGGQQIQPLCDMDIQPATPIWSVSGTNNTCVSANLTLWRGATQGSLSVACFPTVYVEEPAEQAGDKCRGATDCATVTLYSATSNDFSASCGAVSQSLIAPANGSCQSMAIGNVNYSYRVGCTAGVAMGIANYDFRAWQGPACGDDTSSTIHAAGQSLSSSYHLDSNGLVVYDFYQLYHTIAANVDNYCQPITFGQGLGLGLGLPSLLDQYPTLPQRITVTCGGGVQTSGASVYTYDQATATGTGGSASSSGCSRGSVRSVHVVPDIPPNFATFGIGYCHPSDFTRNSRTVFSEMIQCHPDGSFDVELFTYDVNPDPNALHCQPTYLNATIHGTSGQCINKPTLAGPPQPVRIICNGPHLIPNNTNTNGTGTGTGTGTAGGGSGTAIFSTNTNTNTSTGSTSTTASFLSSTGTSASSSSSSSSSSSTSASATTGSGSGPVNGGAGVGSRHPCGAVMMMVAWVGTSLII